MVNILYSYQQHFLFSTNVDSKTNLGEEYQLLKLKIFSQCTVIAEAATKIADFNLLTFLVLNFNENFQASSTLSKYELVFNSKHILNSMYLLLSLNNFPLEINQSVEIYSTTFQCFFRLSFSTINVDREYLTQCASKRDHL